MNTTHGQTIVEIYRNFPIEHTELSLQQKDSLLKFEEYTMPDSDSDHTIVYHVAEIDTVNDYLRVYYDYTTGQAGWSAQEFRLFKSDKTDILVVSLIGGVRVSTHQNGLLLYLVDDKNNLTETRATWSIERKEFFKENTPAELMKDGGYDFCFRYEIMPEEFPDGIGYTAGPCYTMDEETQKLQLKEVINVDWRDGSFMKRSGN